MKILNDHFEGGKNLNDGHKHNDGPTLSGLINELHEQKNYSLEEIDTGGKFLGKTIFRKVIVIGATGGNAIVSFAHGISDPIESIINSGGSFKQSDGDFVPIVNGNFNTNDSAGINSIDDTNINFWIGSVYNGNDAFLSAVVWLEYIKV